MLVEVALLAICAALLRGFDRAELHTHCYAWDSTPKARRERRRLELANMSARLKLIGDIYDADPAGADVRWLFDQITTVQNEFDRWERERRPGDALGFVDLDGLFLKIRITSRNR